jgi:TctA family transporter
MLVYGISSTDTSKDLAYRTWTFGTGWSAETIMDITAISGDLQARWVELASKPGGNEITLAASMYVGNVMLLLLNLPLIGLWVRLLKVPYRRLFPLILVCCVIGAYSVNNSTFDVVVMILFGILGCIFRRYGYEPAPLVMAFILGPIFEKSMRQSLKISGGSFSIFFTRPVSLALLILAALVLLSYILLRKQRAVLDEKEKMV